MPEMGRPRRTEPLRAERDAALGSAVFAVVASGIGLLGLGVGFVPTLYIPAVLAGVVGLSFGLVGLGGRRSGREIALLGTFLAGGALALGISGGLTANGELSELADSERVDAPTDATLAPLERLDPPTSTTQATDGAGPGPSAASPPTTVVPDTAPPATVPPPLTDPLVDGEECTADELGALRYSGTVTNTARIPLSFEVRVEFFDSAGISLGASVDVLEDLAPDAEVAWEGHDVADDLVGEFRCDVRIESLSP